MDLLTWICLAVGIVVIGFAIRLALRKGSWETSWIPFVVGIVLMTLSVWASIEFSPDSVKFSKAALAAADTLALQTQETATAVEANRNQIANLTSLLARKNVLQAQEARSIQLQLNAAPRVDVAKLQRARATFQRAAR